MIYSLTRTYTKLILLSFVFITLLIVAFRSFLFFLIDFVKKVV